MCQQIGQPTQIAIPEMGAAPADDEGGIVRLDVRPRRRHASELARVVVEVDAMLAPRLPAIDQPKRTSMQRMKRMCDSEGLRRITRMRCNRLLNRIRSSSDLWGLRGASASIM
jgi:hypothetical protein